MTLWGCGTAAPNAGFDPVPKSSTGTPALQASAPAPAPSDSAPPAPAPESKWIITPVDLLAGKVVTYNQPGRFVVLNFPVGQLPALDQRMGVYRKGLKVGELKVTGPQRDDNIVADVVEGTAQPGDEVRDR